MSQDHPIKLGKLFVDASLLVFFDENQGAYRWGVLEEHFGDEDPPVHGGYGQDAPEPIAERLSDLLVAKVLYETTFAHDRDSTIGRLRKGVRSGHGEVVGAAVRRRYSRLPVVATGYPPDSELHGDADTIVLLLEDGDWAYAVARTPGAWAVLEDLGFRPGGTWRPSRGCAAHEPWPRRRHAPPVHRLRC